MLYVDVKPQDSESPQLIRYIFFLRNLDNKDENAHKFALSTIRGERERERERKRMIQPVREVKGAN